MERIEELKYDTRGSKEVEELKEILSDVVLKLKTSTRELSEILEGL